MKVTGFLATADPHVYKEREAVTDDADVAGCYAGAPEEIEFERAPRHVVKFPRPGFVARFKRWMGQ